MQSTSDEQGVIQALLERLNNQRLPRLLALKVKVDAGERLSEEDLSFLTKVSEDWERAKPIIDRHPQYHDLGARVVSLYADISEKALSNEGEG